MRGARIACQIRDALVGIIPADAGSTAGDKSDDPTWADHPRGCGEHT